MRVSDKILYIAEFREIFFFGRKPEADEIFKIYKQSNKQKHLPVSDNGGKMRVLQTKNRKPELYLNNLNNLNNFNNFNNLILRGG